MQISFEDALKGAAVRVPVDVETACHVCGGTGADPGTTPKTCPQCQGSGVVSDSHGLFALSQPCPRCRGNGVIIEKPCKNCRGTGRERVTKRYQVKVPAGAKDGTRIRLKGKGEPGRNGGPAGDLFVAVRSSRRRCTSDVAPISSSMFPSRIPRLRSARRCRSRPRRSGRAEDSCRIGERKAPPGEGTRRAEAERRRSR